MMERIQKMAEEIVEIVEGSGEDSDKMIGSLVREAMRVEKLSAVEIGELMIEIEIGMEFVNRFREEQGEDRI